MPASFTGFNLAIDSKGNIYTTEVDTGKRAQKFRYVGPPLIVNRGFVHPRESGDPGFPAFAGMNELNHRRRSERFNIGRYVDHRRPVGRNRSRKRRAMSPGFSTRMPSAHILGEPGEIRLVVGP